MALLDYSKAYDRTWKERLLSKLHDFGTPRQMTLWIEAFLRTRTAEVVINGATCRSTDKVVGGCADEHSGTQQAVLAAVGAVVDVHALNGD